MNANLAVNMMKEHLIQGTFLLFGEVESKKLLINQIKRKLYSQLKVFDFSNVNFQHREIRNRTADLFFYSNIDRCIMMCFKKLDELGYSENEYESFVYDAFSYHLIGKRETRTNQVADLVESLKLYLANYFAPWAVTHDFIIYDNLKKFHLIYLSEKGNWKLSNIGTYFLKLNIMDALTLLCVFITNNSSNSESENKAALRNILEKDGVHLNRKFDRAYEQFVRGFGLTDGNKLEVSLLGRLVFENALSKYAKYKDVIRNLLEAEFVGFYVAVNDETTMAVIEIIKQTDFVGLEYVNRLEEAVRQYSNGEYTIAYNILLPRVEEILNIALEKEKINFQNFGGLFSKYSKLKQIGILTDIDETLFRKFKNFRDANSHGNNTEDASRLGMIITFLRQILDDLIKYYNITS